MNNLRFLGLLVITLFATALLGFIYLRNQQPPASLQPPTATNEATSTAAVEPDISTTTPEQAERWITYTNPERGFSFEYPESWGEVSVVTREEVAEEEKMVNICEREGSCPPPILRAVDWDNEKKLLESNPPDGEVDCVRGLGWASVCRIESFKNRKVLIRYTGMALGGLGIDKYHIFYINNTRIEIKPESYDLGNDPNEPKFIGAENIDWVFKKMFPYFKSTK